MHHTPRDLEGRLARQHLKDQPAQLPGGGHLRRIGPPPGFDPLVEAPQGGVALNGGPDRLDQRPAQPPIALLGDRPMPRDRPRAMGGGDQPGVGGQLPRTPEPPDAVDLHCNQRGQHGPNARNRVHQLHGPIFRHPGRHLRRRLRHLRGQRLLRRQVAGQQRPLGRRQGRRLHPRTPGFGEHILEGMVRRPQRRGLAVQQRVDLVAHTGPQLRAEGPLPQHVLPRPHRRGPNVRRRNQVRPQEVRQRPRVDRVGLDPRRGDRLHLQRMRQRDRLRIGLHQVMDHRPIATGLNDHRPLIRGQRLHERRQRVRRVRHIAAFHHPALRGHHGEMRPELGIVDPHVLHAHLLGEESFSALHRVADSTAAVESEERTLILSTKSIRFLFLLQPRNQHFIGRLDFLRHGFGPFVGLHVLFGIVGEVGIALGMPGQQEFPTFVIQPRPQVRSMQLHFGQFEQDEGLLKRDWTLWPGLFHRRSGAAGCGSHERRVAVVEAVELKRKQRLAGGDHRRAAVCRRPENVQRTAEVVTAPGRRQLVLERFRRLPVGGQKRGAGGIPAAEHEGQVIGIPIRPAGGIGDEEARLGCRAQLG